MSDLVNFQGKKIRRHWDAKKAKWYFSVVDIIQVLVQQSDYKTARKYWNKLKERLKKEGSESVTNCHQLKLGASDGKRYLTDVADVETLLRLIQSVPSPKAELSTRQIAEVDKAKGLEENNIPARKEFTSINTDHLNLSKSAMTISLIKSSNEVFGSQPSSAFALE